jgi:hypothetical protein
MDSRSPHVPPLNDSLTISSMRSSEEHLLDSARTASSNSGSDRGRMTPVAGPTGSARLSVKEASMDVRGLSGPDCKTAFTSRVLT